MDWIESAIIVVIAACIFGSIIAAIHEVRKAHKPKTQAKQYENHSSI